MGAGGLASAAGESTWMQMIRPTLQIGHWRDTGSVVVEYKSLEEPTTLFVGAAGRGGSKERQSASFSLRWRLARNPKWANCAQPAKNVKSASESFTPCRQTVDL